MSTSHQSLRVSEANSKPEVLEEVKNQPPADEEMQEESSESIAEGFFEVEQIMKHRHRMPRNTTERQLELLIKWKKYDHSEDTWEPLYDLYDDIKNLSRDYFKGKGLAIIRK